MAAPAAPVDYDNTNVNYGAKDGFDVTVTERAQIINGASTTFDPSKHDVFFLAIMGILHTLNNIDRIASAVEQVPIQIQAETLASYIKDC